jgi:hypothetical protein
MVISILSLFAIGVELSNFAIYASATLKEDVVANEWASSLSRFGRYETRRASQSLSLFYLKLVREGESGFQEH